MKYIKVTEAANICGVTPQAIRCLCKSKAIRYKKRGCNFEVCLVDVENHAEKIKEVSKIELEIDELIALRRELRDKLVKENDETRRKITEMRLLPKRLKLLCSLMSQEMKVYRDHFSEEDYEEAQSILCGFHCIGREGSVIRDNHQFERLESRIRKAMSSIRGEVETLKVELSVRDRIIDELKKKTESDIIKNEDVQKDYMLELLNTDIKYVKMSVRLYNCLRAMDVDTLGDACEYEKRDYLKTRNFGKKSLNELEKIFESRGLYFGMNVKKYYREQV